MGRAPCCDKASVKRGPWSPDEDEKLKQYIHSHGTGGNWIALPHKAGLNRCGKSCRLRWLNYLRPNLKHGDFTDDEDRIIYSLFTTIGSRWSIIAAQLPGRTDNDIKNYWNTKLKKKLSMGFILSSSDPPPPPPPPNVWSFAGSAANDDPSPSCKYINPLLPQQPYYYGYDHLIFENSIGPDQASCSSSDGGSGGTHLGYGGGEMEYDYGGYNQQRVMVSESCGVMRKEKVESGVWKEEIPLECSLEEISKLMSSSNNNNNNNNFSFENYKSTGETFMYYY